MRQPDNPLDAAAVTEKTSLFLLAIALSAVEFFIPRIPLFPWLKPGLANVVTVVWIIRYGVSDALLYTILRTWAVGFYFGFSFVTLTLALSGGIVAVLGMGLLWRLTGRGKYLGTIGLAIAGAALHNTAQLTTVYLLMAPSMQLLYQLPAMLVASLGFGALVGSLVPSLYQSLVSQPAAASAKEEMSDEPSQPRPHQIVLSLVLFTFCMAMVVVRTPLALGAAAAGITLLVQLLDGFSLRTLFYPLLRFPLLFLFIGTLHLFFTYGIRYEHLPWITHQGLRLAVNQWLRLWIWLQTFFLFRKFNFHGVMLAGLRRLFPHRRDTVYAGLLALERFPSLLRMVRAQARHLLRLLLRHPSHLLHTLFLQTTELV